MVSKLSEYGTGHQLETKDRVNPDTKEAEVHLRNLHDFDPDLEEEDIRSILDSLPHGWLGKSLILRFNTVRIKSEPLLARNRSIMEPGLNEIRIFSRARHIEPHDLWGKKLLHELAHINDWDGNCRLTAEEKELLRAEVCARTKAPDRYKSEYVEDTDWEGLGLGLAVDERSEEERKATEYWAEITRVYFSSSNPSTELSINDLQIIERVIRKTDSSFDQQDARIRREAVVKKIETKKTARLLEKILSDGRLDEQEKSKLRNAVSAGPSTESLVPMDQRSGRLEIANFLKQHGANNQIRELLKAFLSMALDFDWFLKVVTVGHPIEIGNHYDSYLKKKKSVSQMSERVGAAGVKILDELQEIIKRYNISFGGTKLQAGEFAEYLMEDVDDSDWIMESTGWAPNEADTSFAEQKKRQSHPDRYTPEGEEISII